MSAHMLHIREIDDEGRVFWRLTCEHPEEDERWWCREPTGEFVQPPGADGCWFESWWGALGSDLLGRIEGPFTFPIPVKPSGDWDYENGGTIVRDDALATPVGLVTSGEDTTP